MQSTPIFVSGMPRSGTKLLRDLLNNHSNISIPKSETHFIPEFIQTYGLDYDFGNKENIQCLLDRFYRTKFCGSQSKRPIEIDDIFAIGSPLGWATFLEAILRYYGVKNQRSAMFGDKTPGYVLHLALLAEIWPGIKLVHIIRDPRDYCASVRFAWGMSLKRAAYRWHQTMLAALEYPDIYPGNYLEVRYEALLSDPDYVLSGICDFIGCEFEEQMTELNQETENLGSAKGHIGVVRGNKNQYLKNLNATEIRTIERICCDSGKALGYFTDETLMPLEMGKIQLLFLKLYDGLNAIYFHMREKGIVAGTRYFFKLYHDGAFRKGVS